MKINGLSGANTPAGGMNTTQATDPVSKNIQNQIANAQKQLQELSANKEMSMEEKMKKRQEIQKQIADLNNQLRQHEIEQRREKQQAKNASKGNMSGGKKADAKEGKQEEGFSQASMKAMISADSAMAQAQVQGSVSEKMKGRVSVLETEIKLDVARGDDVEGKQKELFATQDKETSAKVAQMSTLADANKELGVAAKAEQETEKAETKDEKTDKKDAVSDEKEDKKAAGAEKKDAEDVDGTTEMVSTEAAEAAGMVAPKNSTYTHVDVLV